MFSYFFSGLKLQDSGSLVMREFIYFHDISFYVTLSVSVLVAVGLMAKFSLINSFSSVYLEQKLLEIGWTLLPAFILVLLALPSLQLLFFLEAPTSLNPDQSVKMVGHQWYWTFDTEMNSNPTVQDIYMVPSEDLELGGFRKLEVDVAIPVKVKSFVRFVSTAADVLHSFAVPALGVKVDAVPGRLNHQSVLTSTLGMFYGQCSEICGANHSFMPVSVEVVG